MHVISRFLVLCFVIAPTSLLAQWSSNPNINLAVSDTSGRQELPKIAVTTDGGCYVSWFDTRSGAYRVYMQRLNAQGIKQWGENGLLISANPQNTSLVDYDLTVDDSNCAVVVFTDIRNGGQIEPFAYRISPAGSFVWGVNGVGLSTSPATFQANPRVANTSDGDFVFAWIFSSSPRKVALQKLNAAGIKQWGVDPILISGTGTENLDYPAVVGCDTGSVILMNSGYTGSFINPANYRIYARKISRNGISVWNANPDTVYGLGRVSGFFVPKLIPDGSNGAFCVWHDDRNSTGSSFSHAQHITSSGTKLFPANGAAGSTLPGRLHNDAWVAYTPLTGETYMFWYETDAALQSSYGVYGQKLSSNGTRQWADSGKALRPFGGGQPSFIRSFGKDSSAVVYFLDGVTVTTNLVRGFRVDRNGNVLWGGTIKDVSSVASSKGRLGGVMTQTGNSILVWSDNRSDDNGVYAQELNLNGELGVIASVRQSVSELPGSYELHQNYPNPFNPSTTISYQISTITHVSLNVYDVLGREVAVLLSELKEAGTHQLTVDASNLASGVYFYRLRAGAYVDSKKMILAK
ncbi:MAG: T9SS type A sorting domain-containing protein [Bacteroidetes bacterium]|nr:T9SS type A sorting domain-containing protein [Bacteroidota bacterium]MCW5895924.1 T9SS type A sorting domain-containing protein [Bacteroidota bacterium]